MPGNIASVSRWPGGLVASPALGRVPQYGRCPGVLQALDGWNRGSPDAGVRRESRQKLADLAEPG